MNRSALPAPEALEHSPENIAGDCCQGVPFTEATPDTYGTGP